MQQKFQIVLPMRPDSHRAVLRLKRTGRTWDPQRTDVGASVLVQETGRVLHTCIRTPAGCRRQNCWMELDVMKTVRMTKNEVLRQFICPKLKCLPFYFFAPSVKKNSFFLVIPIPNIITPFGPDCEFC